MWTEYAINYAALFLMSVIVALFVLGMMWVWMKIEERDNDGPPFDGVVILTPMDELNELMRQSFEEGWERGRLAA